MKHLTDHPLSPTQQRTMELVKHRVKFVSNLYDESGEAYGIYGEYYYQERKRIAQVFSVRWQFIAKVNPEIREVKKDIEEIILEDLTSRVGKLKEVNFEL